MKFLDDILGPDLREALLEKFEEAGIAHDYIEMEMPDELTIILHGEIYSESELRKLKKLLREHTSAEEVDDADLVVVESNFDTDEEQDDNEYISDEISPLREEFAGTEDMYRALEDGIPYIPPTDAPEKP